jgi:SAM-dependent methyltransferase
MRDGVDSEFFLKEASVTKGKVLEVGVGTGRLFKNAIGKGIDIYGIDISPNMIDVLKNKIPENEHYRISLQNIIDFKFDIKFDLVIAPFRVFMHLSDKEDQLRALNNIYYHLEKGGKFVFDAFVPELGQLIKGLDNVVDFEGEYEPGNKIRRIVSTSPDLINQLINIRFKIEWDGEDGFQNEVWNTSLRFFFRYELEHLIERSSFDSYEIYGDYKGHKLQSNSKEFIAACYRH